MSKDDADISRDFKGVWIPKERKVLSQKLKGYHVDAEFAKIESEADA